MTAFEVYCLITGAAFGGWATWYIMIGLDLRWRHKVREDADARIKRYEEMCRRDVALTIAEVEAVTDQHEERWREIRRIYGLHGFRGAN